MAKRKSKEELAEQLGGHVDANGTIHLPADEPTDDGNLDVAIAFAADTLTGDMRDQFLDRLRHEQNKQPWHLRSEADQRETVHQVEAMMRDMVERAVEIIAAHGRRTIRATVEQVPFKDGIKAVLTTSKFDANRHHLSDAQGKTVLIVVADADEFTGEQAPVEISPDQAAMFEDTMAVHSEPDGSAGNPLH